MSVPARKASLVLVLLAFAAYAYAPLAGAGFVQDDLAVLAGVGPIAFGGELEFADLFRVPGTDGRIGAALSMLVSAWFWSGWQWSSCAEWTPADAAWIRGENFALLLLASWGLLYGLRRALEPWTGKEHARGASRAVALLFVVHPIVVSSVVRLDARGDLLALALGTAAMATFLKGRQEQRHTHTLMAGVLVIAAGLCSPIAFYHPIALTLLEYCSARRHRARHLRVRTSATTFVVFSTCVALESFLRAVFIDSIGVAARPVAQEALADGLLQTLLLGIEKLGVLMLPVNAFGIGGLGYLFAAIVLLVSMHPAFVAARSAPRLWGRILFGWLVAIGLTELPAMSLRVYPQSLENAHVLLFSALIMSIGLGIGATALSGVRRLILPLIAAALYATLAQAAARPVRAVSDQLDVLRAELLEEARARNWNGHFMILDAPRRVEGLTSLRGSWSLLLDLTFVPHAIRPKGEVRMQATAISTDAFYALVRESEFDSMRHAGLTLMVPTEALAVEGLKGRWQAVDLQAPKSSEGALVWRSEGNSPTGQVLEALSSRAIVVNALPSTSTLKDPELRWSSRSEILPSGEFKGAWYHSENGPVAVFDQGSSLDWLLGGRIRATWFTGELSSIASAEVRSNVPDFDGRVGPLIRDDDWIFDLGELPIPESFSRERQWSLGVLDLGSFEYQEFEVLGSAVDGLRVKGVEVAARRRLARGSGPLVWYLTLAFDGATAARASGRIRS
ncbi:MAG: hypothetical protein ACI841_002627 [Planctomycetota bacterium]|jgi:hypothetical protein